MAFRTLDRLYPGVDRFPPAGGEQHLDLVLSLW
jgi:hypothetical protein